MNIFDKANLNSILNSKLDSNELLAYRYEGNKLFLKVPKADLSGTRFTRANLSKKYFFDFEMDTTNIGSKELVGLFTKKILANSAQELKDHLKKELREVKIKNITR